MKPGSAPSGARTGSCGHPAWGRGVPPSPPCHQPCVPPPRHAAWSLPGLEVAAGGRALPNTATPPVPCRAPVGAASSGGQCPASGGLAQLWGQRQPLANSLLSLCPACPHVVSAQHRPASPPPWPSPRASRSGSRRKVSVQAGTGGVSGLGGGSALGGCHCSSPRGRIPAAPCALPCAATPRLWAPSQPECSGLSGFCLPGRAWQEAAGFGAGAAAGKAAGSGAGFGLEPGLEGPAGLHVAAVMLELLLAWLQPGRFLLWPCRGCWHRAELAALVGSCCASLQGLHQPGRFSLDFSSRWFCSHSIPDPAWCPRVPRGLGRSLGSASA